MKTELTRGQTTNIDLSKNTQKVSCHTMERPRDSG